MRLYVDTLHDVVVVPTPAVQRGPDGAFVYVVKDDKVTMTKVTTGRQTETVTVLTAGLAPPADVVTTGFTRLTDGAKVCNVSRPAQAGDRPAPTSAAPASAGESEASATEGAPAAEGSKAVEATSKDDATPKEHHGHHRREGAQAGATN